MDLRHRKKDMVEVSPRALQTYITQLCDNINQSESILFKVAQNNFQLYVESAYRLAEDSNEANYFLDELFVAISLQQQSAISHIFLLNSLIDVYLGDKISKANRMTRDLINLPAIPNQKIWDGLANLLTWMTKTLRASIQLILKPLADSMWLWCYSKEIERCISGLMLMKIFLTKFPGLLEEHFFQVQSIIRSCMDNANDGIRNAAEAALTAAISHKETREHFGVVTLCASLNFTLSEKKWTDYSGALRAANIIVSIIPENLACFTFVSLPLMYLHDKDLECQLATLKVLSFALRTTPSLFNADIIVNILTEYKKLLKKKSVFRRELLLTFSEFLFQRKLPYHSKEISLIQKIRSQILDQLDCEQACHSLIAINSVLELNSHDFVHIFKQQLTDLIVDGFYKLTKNNPKTQNFIHAHIINYANSIVLSQSTSQQIATYCNSFIKLDIPTNYFSTPMIYQILLYLNHPEYSVRTAAASFISFYTSKKPSNDYSQLMLSAACTESSTDLKMMLIRSCTLVQPFRDEVLIPIKTLLQDKQALIKKAALDLLASHVSDSRVAHIFKDFLAEQVTIMKNESEMTKRAIYSMLMITTALEGNNEDFLNALFTPFASFIIFHLIDSKKKLPTCALSLLSHIIAFSPTEIDSVKLVKDHISTSLSIHSSKKRLDAALDLIMAALKYTNLMFSIYKENFYLVKMLIDLGGLNESDITRSKLLAVISQIGSVRKELFDSDLVRNSMTIHSTSYFISLLESNQPVECLIFASVGVSLSLLFGILRDESFSALHASAIEALLTVIKVQSQFGKLLENTLIKQMNDLLTYSGPSTSNILLSNITTLIAVLGDRFRPLVPHVIDFICQKWTKLDKSQLLRITDWLVNSTHDAVAPFIPRIATVFINGFMTYDERTVDGVFSVFVSFGFQVSSITHIIYPPMLLWISYNAKSQIINDVLTKTRFIFINGGTANFSGQIVQTLMDLMKQDSSLQERLLDIMCIVAAHCGLSFLLFLPRLISIFDIFSHPILKEIITVLKNGQKISSFKNLMDFVAPDSRTQASAFKKKSSLQKTRESSFVAHAPKLSSDEIQWLNWSNDFFYGIVRNSISRAISACYTLCMRHAEICRIIYPLAISLVYVLSIEDPLNKAHIIKIFERVFSGGEAPRSVVRHFLAALEILEILGIKLPISNETIAQSAQNAGVFTQALRATEYMFENNVDVAEKLIILNQTLNLPLAAAGVLNLSHSKGFDIKQDVMAEKLGMWEEALKYTDKSLAAHPKDLNLINRRVKFLSELARYDEIRSLQNVDIVMRASADLHLFDYKSFMNSCEQLSKQKYEYENDRYKWYLAIFYVMKNEKQKAMDLISELRTARIPYLFPAINEDYDRIIVPLSQVDGYQQLVDVINVLEMKKSLNSPIPSERQKATDVIANVKRVWKERFNLMNKSQKSLHRFLYIGSLAFDPTDFQEEWLAFLETTLSNKSFSLTKSVLNYLKFKVKSTEKTFLDRLSVIDCRLSHETGNLTAVNSLQKIVSSITDQDLAEECANILSNWVDSSEKVRESLKSVIGFAKNSETFENWSRTNLRLYKQMHDMRYLEDALTGAINGVVACESRSVSLSLLILNILFMANENDSDFIQIFAERSKNVLPHKWIDIVPQIIARLTREDTPLHKALFDLLYSIGESHPNAILYPMMVQLKSDNETRRGIAEKIFAKLELKYTNITSIISAIANEMMRVSVSWYELTYQCIDDASHEYCPDVNKEKMLKCLQPIKDILNQNCETCFESKFASQNFSQLNISFDLLEKYAKNNDEGSLHEAWDHLSSVFNNLRTVCQEMNEVLLSEVSPVLYKLKNSDLVVPGTYEYGKSPVTVSSFKNVVKIINSKQRPRKICVDGSDGVRYKFLLKAHEDTRLDERVMQLFHFINTLIDHSNIRMKSFLSLTTYNVVPITGEVGLIGWVKDCGTLHEAVKEYRKKRGVKIQAEQQATINYAPNYDTLKIDDKIVAFKKGLQATDGLDVRRILLSSSPSTSSWLMRRSTYSSSMAVTSMAGYILGLGDRHFSNIMIGKNTAKLVHIDFGDCFEVAMHRDRYPETVPFRLTRMLVNALEVSKIEGTFRSLCESSMEIMRQNGNQILSLLEAFIHDPLLQRQNKHNTSLAVDDAVSAVKRISDKLSGSDFEGKSALKVPDQVELLIQQATDEKNLCQMFSGWCPWW